MSDLSSSRRSTKFSEAVHETRYRWQSVYEYICTSLIYSISVGNYIKPNLRTEEKANAEQFILALLLMGVPVQYMQTALGQYSQRSAIFLRHATPLAHGLGYSCMLLNGVYLLPQMIAVSDYFLYFLNSFQQVMPWMVCQESYKDKCWNGTRCLTKCLIKEHTSTYFYWNYTHMRGEPEKPYFKEFSIRRPIIVLVFLLVIYCCVINVKTVADRKIRYTTYVSIIGMLLVLGAITAYNTVGEDHEYAIYQFEFSYFTNFKSWYRMFWDSVLYCNLGFGGHILLGSYMEPSTYSGIYVFFSSVSFIIFSIIILLIPKTSIAILTAKAKLTVHDNYHIYVHDDEYFRLTILPAALRYLYIPQFWSIIYFSACILGNITFIVLNIKVILLSLCDLHPNVLNYQKTVLLVYLLFCFVGSIGITIKGFFYYTVTQLNRSLDATSVLLTSILTSVICLIYGINRFCDDIRFITGEAPNKITKILWILSPIPLSILAAAYFVQLAKKEHSWFGLTCMLILIMPVLVMATVEIFKYATIKHLAGVFQAEDLWGPPTYYLKEKRKLFKPSNETRPTNESYRCRHRCLLKSELVKLMINAENDVHHLYSKEVLKKYQ